MPETAAAVKTVALTGATGFIGARILQKLLERGTPVRALTRCPQPQATGIDWISGDLNDAGALKELVKGADAVIHCAGLVKARSAEEFDRVNHQGSRSLCQAVRAVAGSGEKSVHPHFILISSLAARLPEISAYAASKHASEKAVRESLEDRPWTVLRPPGVYGPGDVEILKLLRVMRRGVALAPGSQDSRFSLLHVGDLAEAVCAALWQPRVFSKMIELDDGKSGGYSMDEVRLLAESIFGRRIRTITVPEGLLHFAGAANEIAARLVGGAPMLTRGKARELVHADWVSTGEKLATLINWKPQFDLEAGLGDTVAWCREKKLL